MRATPVPRVLLVLRVPWEPRVLKELRPTLVPLVLLAEQVPWVPQELLVLLVLRVQLVSRVIRVLMVLMETTVLRELMETTEPRELQVPWALPERMVSPAIRVPWVPWVGRGTREPPVCRVLLVMRP